MRLYIKSISFIIVMRFISASLKHNNSHKKIKVATAKHAHEDSEAKGPSFSITGLFSAKKSEGSEEVEKHEEGVRGGKPTKRPVSVTSRKGKYGDTEENTEEKTFDTSSTYQAPVTNVLLKPLSTREKLNETSDEIRANIKRKTDRLLVVLESFLKDAKEYKALLSKEEKSNAKHAQSQEVLNYQVIEVAENKAAPKQ